jgi:hypothetical protein
MRLAAAVALAMFMLANGPAASAPAETNAQTNEERRANDIAAALESLIGSPRAQSSRQTAEAPAAYDAARDGPCTRNGLIHAEVSPEITQRVQHAIRIVLNGARVREASQLVLPCGFSLWNRFSASLVLHGQQEYRRYRENNPFGFMPAFGFSRPQATSYELRYETVTANDLHQDECGETVRSHGLHLQMCSSFGSVTQIFGTSGDGDSTLLAHYVVSGTELKEDFRVAEIAWKVDSLFFMPPPDAPGGSITLVLEDDGNLYRVFLDVPRG